MFPTTTLRFTHFLIDHNSIKNPYNTSAPGVRSGFGYTVGQVNISSTGNVNNKARLNFMTCLKEPCSGTNVIEEFLYFEE